MKLMKLIGAAILAVSISACAYLPDSPATRDGKKAVAAALTTYTQIYQPAVLAYGRLPVCPQPAPMLCRDVKVFAKLAQADAAVAASAKAADKVLHSDFSSPGTALQDVMSAITTAQIEIAASGLLSRKEN